MNYVSCDICVYHLRLFVFPPKVFLSSRVTGACPVTTDFIILRVNVRTTTATTTTTTTTTYTLYVSKMNNKHGSRVYSTHITKTLLVMLPAVLQFIFCDSGKFRSMKKRYCCRTENCTAANITAGYQYIWQGAQRPVPTLDADYRLRRGCRAAAAVWVTAA